MKRLLIICIAAVLLLGLTACGNASSTMQETGNETTTEVSQDVTATDATETTTENTGSTENVETSLANGEAPSSEAASTETATAEIAIDSIMGYSLFLRNGNNETVDIYAKRDGQEWLLLNIDSATCRQEDFGILFETFDNIMGHSGIILHRYYSISSETQFCDMDYYALDGETPIHLAYNWSTHGVCNNNAYSVDINGDGTDELLCNVQYRADGAMDTHIFHWDSEKVYQISGVDMLLANEPDTQNAPSPSFGAEYFPETNTISAQYWSEARNEQIIKERVLQNIDLSKVQMWEYQ